MKTPHPYAELHCISNFTFLRGASRPEELVTTAAELGYRAIAITDECSMAGIVRAHTQAKKTAIKLIIGCEFRLEYGFRLVLLARDHTGYTSLCSLISDARCNAEKGDYLIEDGRLEQVSSEHCIAILIPPHFADQHRNLQPEPERDPGPDPDPDYEQQQDNQSNRNPTDTANSTLQWFKKTFIHHWMSLTVLHTTNDQSHIDHTLSLAAQYEIPLVASGDVHMLSLIHI